MCVDVLLELLLLNETTLVLVDDGEGLLHVVVGLFGQSAGGKELLVVEWSRVWKWVQIGEPTVENNQQSKLHIKAERCSEQRRSCGCYCIRWRLTFAPVQGCSDVSIRQSREGHSELQKSNKKNGSQVTDMSSNYLTEFDSYLFHPSEAVDQWITLN